MVKLAMGSGVGLRASKTKKRDLAAFFMSGAPGRIRTSDPLVRSYELENQLADLFNVLAVAPVAKCATEPDFSALTSAKLRQRF